MNETEYHRQRKLRENFVYASATGLLYLQLMVVGALTEDIEDYFDHLKLTIKAG